MCSYADDGVVDPCCLPRDFRKACPGRIKNLFHDRLDIWFVRKVGYQRRQVLAFHRSCTVTDFYRAMLCIRGTSHVPVSVSVCVCVRPSQVGVLLKRLKVGSHKEHHTIAQGI